MENKGSIMPTTVKLSEALISAAKVTSKAFNRSVSQQIEHWVKIGKNAEENPHLTYQFMKENEK